MSFTNVDLESAWRPLSPAHVSLASAPSSARPASGTAQSAWNPGLENGESLLRDVFESMPRDPELGVAWYVKILENPKSPLALAGAVELFGHDCIHIALGRGLLQQDEAFVLGFTMGASRRCPAWHEAAFRFCARHLYQGVYRFSELDAQVFEFARRAARRLEARDIHLVNFRSWMDRPVKELRAALGIVPDALSALYAAERALWPHTAASQRLYKLC